MRGSWWASAACGRGLPNGSGANHWTSDEVGYNSDTDAFYAEVLSWTGTEVRYAFSANGVPKQATAAYRCIYYPLDLTYPAPTTCNGGLLPDRDQRHARAVDVARFDRARSLDVRRCDGDLHRRGRAPRVRACLSEAARSGLPNGSGTLVLTSDLSNFGGPSVMAVRWSGTDAMFSDQYPTYVGSGQLQPRPFRGVWTNEQR
ncbi:hypothetical protein BH11MYX1_BH11MYX1_02940 [soil metagenome]